MECDIHIVLERKCPVQGSKKWVGWARFVSYTLAQRNYAFFNALCGVRGSGSEFGHEPRGIPEDASDMTQACIGEDDGDLHSHSWLTIRELVPCLAAHWGDADKQPQEYVFERMAEADGNLYLATRLLDEDITAENADEWRLVFAFDN
jgi:hypothetical protein